MKTFKVIIKKFAVSLMPHTVGDIVEMTVLEYERYRDFVEKYTDGPDINKQVSRSGATRKSKARRS